MGEILIKLMKCGKKSTIASKKFNREPAHNKKYLKTKIKFYKGKISTKKGAPCMYISIMLIDSVYRKDENYYPQVFLEKQKYVVKEISSICKKFFKLGARNFFRVGFFENYLLKHKKFF